MRARSGDPINHPYWGRIIHDMSGMIVQKESITVDYTHGFDEVIGYADKFSASNDGLEVSGALVSVHEQDRAAEVYLKGKAGVPYEASIDWEGDDLELEYIPEDVTTEVNGQQFAGPGYVARRWPLRALSICRYGCDADTRTQFSKGQTGEESVVSVRVFSQTEGDSQVADNKPGDKPTETQQAAQAPEDAKQHSETPAEKPAADAGATQNAVAPGSISLDTLKQFSDEFGNDLGTQYLRQGLTLEAARFQFAQHKQTQAEAETKKLRDQLAERDRQLGEASSKLKQFGESLGQETPVDTAQKEEPATDPRFKQFAMAGGDNRAKFACGIKLPKKSEA